MSSFKRTVKPAASGSNATESTHTLLGAQPDYILQTGTKPWVNTGLGIVSTGNKQLDELVGGGSALGTLTIVESDSFSTYGATLLLYGLAESISHKHGVLIVAEDVTEAERLVANIPYNQTVGSSGQDVIADANTVTDENSGTDNKLTIAWQYGKYIKSKDTTPKPAPSSGEPTLPTYCSSYDLSRRLQPSILSCGAIDLCPVSTIHSTATDGTKSAEDYLNGIAAAVQSFLTKKEMHEKYVTRIVISCLDQILTTVAEITNTQCAVLRVAAFVLQLKHLVRACTTCRCSLHITVNPSNVSSQLVARLRQVADTVLSVESFAGRTHSVPYEFKEFQGFLVVHKIQQYGSMAPFRPPGTRFGLKRDRRKLHIEPLHLPPEESRAFSTTGGAQTSSASASASVSEREASVGSSAVGKDHSVAHSHTSATAVAAGVSHMSMKEGDASASAGVKSTGSAGAGARAASSSSGQLDAQQEAVPAVSVPLTPLQASLAALKAARASASATASASSATTSASSTTATSAVASANQSTPAVPLRVAPVSIQRPVLPAVPVAAAGVKESSKPPLQPGQACGQSRGGGSQDSKYDF